MLVGVLVGVFVGVLVGVLVGVTVGELVGAGGALCAEDVGGKAAGVVCAGAVLWAGGGVVIVGGSDSVRRGDGRGTVHLHEILMGMPKKTSLTGIVPARRARETPLDGCGAITRKGRGAAAGAPGCARVLQVQV